MNKLGLLFPGQGAQYVGMGRELYDNFSEARECFDKANEVLELDIKKLCFEGSVEELSKTENTQPSMFTMARAITQILTANKLEANYCGGLSLGEYSALNYAGVLTFEDGLRLIRKRGLLMREAVPQGVGGMAAVLGLDNNTILDYCGNIDKNQVLEIANYNCPGQIVITGGVEAVNRAVVDLKALGALKVIPLSVSGPFHSSLLKGASDKLSHELSKINISSPNKRVISNYDNEYYLNDINNIMYKLVKQIASSVRWEDNVRKLISDGVETFIEIGPGKVLSGFMKKIDKSKVVYNIEDMKSLENVLDKIK